VGPANDGRSFYDPAFIRLKARERHILSRIRVLALLAALVALASVLAACGGGGGGSTGSEEDPQKVIESATLEGVKSGNLDLALNVNAEGEQGGKVKVDVSGPFEKTAKEEIPQLEMAIKAKGDVSGENVDFDGNLTVLTDRAFIGFEGETYEVDPTTFGFVKSGFEQAQQEQTGTEAGTTACEKAVEKMDFGNIVENLSNDGSEEVDGTETTKLSGDLNVSGAIDALVKLSESPACASELEAAGPLPLGELESAEKELKTAVKKAHVEVFVGDDHIVRKFAAELAIEPTEAKGEKVEVDMSLSLGEVNEKQTFTAPSGAKPIEGLFQKLGVNPLELLEGGGAGGLGGLLEGIDGGLSGGESPSTAETGGATEAQLEYVECLKGAKTPSDLQKCATLLK
jgi:hypothetical protein